MSFCWRCVVLEDKKINRDQQHTENSPSVELNTPPAMGQANTRFKLKQKTNLAYAMLKCSIRFRKKRASLILI